MNQHSSTQAAWHEKLIYLVFGTYTLFLAGFFFVPNAVDLYKFYIALVFLPGLLLLPGGFQATRKSRIFTSLMAYLTYMLLSSLWSEDFSAGVLWRDVRYTAYIISFILLTVYFFQHRPKLPPLTLRLVTTVVALAAIVSLLLFEPTAPLPAVTDERLVGIGITDNPNPSAFIYGLFGVITLHFTLKNSGNKLVLFPAFGYGVIALFVILTQSNTGILALISSSALLFFFGKEHKLLKSLIGGLLAIAAFAFLFWSLGFMASTIDLGFVQRFPIWRQVLEQWQASPIFGNGLQNELLLTAEGKESPANYAHSLFLSTLRDGGLVGVLLVLSVYLLALHQGLKMALIGQGALYLSLLIFGLLVVLVDVDQAITRPRELWIILWLPLAYLMACELGVAGNSPTNSPAGQASHPGTIEDILPPPAAEKTPHPDSAISPNQVQNSKFSK